MSITIYQPERRKRPELLNLPTYRLENLESHKHALMNFSLTANGPCGVELQAAC